MIIDYDTVDFKSQRQERTMLWKVPESHGLCQEGSVPGECAEMWISSNRKYITLYSLKLYTRECIFMSRLGCLVGPKQICCISSELYMVRRTSIQSPSQFEDFNRNAISAQTLQYIYDFHNSMANLKLSAEVESLNLGNYHGFCLLI